MGPNFNAPRVSLAMATALLTFGVSLAGGCGATVPDAQSSPGTTSNDPFFGSAERRYESVSERELSRLINRKGQPVLIEYGVDFNCARCDQMTPIINQLAEQFQGQALIVRTGFQPTSADQLRQGIRVCPTYLFYSDGKMVAKCDGPTLLPILKSKLSRLVSDNSSPGKLFQPAATERPQRDAHFEPNSIR